MSATPPPLPDGFNDVGEKLEAGEKLSDADRALLRRTAVEQVKWLRDHRPLQFKELMGVLDEIGRAVR